MSYDPANPLGKPKLRDTRVQGEWAGNGFDQHGPINSTGNPLAAPFRWLRRTLGEIATGVSYGAGATLGVLAVIEIYSAFAKNAPW